MSYQQAFICDVCGALKQETNHWIIAREKFEDGSILYALWGHTIAIASDRRHLCGAECAAKHLSNYLGKLKETA